MKKRSMLCAIILFLVVGIAHAQNPTYQFAEAGTKNFITETTLEVGDQISLDLYLSNVGAPQEVGGAWIDFTASIDSISYVSGGRCLAGDAEGCTGPWQDNTGAFINEPDGAGTVVYVVGRYGGAVPDDDGDLLLGKLTLQRTSAGDATVNLTTIPFPSFVTWTPINDADIVPGTLLIQQVQTCTVDEDCDDTLFCTGFEMCVGGFCQTDAPCQQGETCNEDTATCDIPPSEVCTVDEDCDDTLFCTGFETCVGGFCQTDAPCQQGEICNEDTATCDIPPSELYKFDRMWPTLKEPWYFSLPKGIARDSSGNIYVVDSSNNLVHKFNPDGTLITKWGGFGDGNGEFNQPVGIAMDSMGDLYITDRKNHRIQKFSPDGTFLTLWEGEGTEPYGITIDTADTVYVTDSSNHYIIRFTSGGDFIPPVWRGESEGIALDEPKGLAFDNEGYIYVADYRNNRILKFNLEGTPVNWASGGEFNLPYGIAVDSLGAVYVSDMLNHRIQKFSPAGVLITAWGSYGSGDGDFNMPRGITVDENGNTYVADSHNGRIEKFSPDGTFMTKWTSKGFDEGFFDAPRGIATDTLGNIYIADAYNNRIQKFDSEGAFISILESWDSGNDRLNWPQGIALNLEGYMYVADTGNDRIVQFASDGSFVRTWGSSGDGNSKFDMPMGIAIDADRNVYVADTQNQRIQKFNSEGTFIASWGSQGQGDREFDLPLDVTLDIYNNVYVADTENHRIQKFTSDGNFLTSWGGLGTEAGKFNSPHGISVDPSGYVYVTDSENDRVQKFTPDGSYVSEWGNSGIGPGDLRLPTKILINPVNEKIYVSDTYNNRIQVFRVVVTPDNPKAIIVAGGGPYPGNTLWDATQVSANFAYRALTYRGFTKDDIYYLTSDTDLDLDGNRVFDEITGFSDDVDRIPTHVNLQYAITQWAVQEEADSLILYLTDHGGADTFRMHEGVDGILSSDDLDTWLDQLQPHLSDKIEVIYDACDSGSFLNDLQGNDRIIITSTLPGEQAKFLSQGTISFSSFFWTHVFNGLSIEEAHFNASQIVSFAFSAQNPQLQGDARHIYIGSGPAKMIGEAAEIGSISPPQELDLETSADLYAQPNSDTISRVWAMIWPPDFNPGPVEDPLLAVPTLELTYNEENGRYEGTYDDFTSDGTYQIVIYAMDRNNNTSLPLLTTVSRNYHLTRKAIIIAGGESPGLTRQMIEAHAGLAYDALKAQLYEDDDISFRSMTTFRTEVDGAPSSGQLESHLSTLVDPSTENLDLVIYLIGAGEIESFMIDDTQELFAEDLSRWLDTLQDAISARVIFVYDGDKSESFIPRLASPSERERLLITSTRANSPAYFMSEGNVAFSSFFWSQVASGATVYNAVAYAKKALSYLTQKGQISFSCYEEQTPQLEADGDGVTNEEEDYQAARSRTIGIGMKFADDPPQIGAVHVERIAEEITITAYEISSTASVEKVWAVIEPIGYCPYNAAVETASFEERELFDDDEDGIYESTAAVPAYAHKVVVYAMDEKGETSAPMESRVYHTREQDMYEDDDEPSQATVVVVDHPTPQPHNFDTVDDEDWVKFYGVEKDENYTIEAGNLGDNCPVIELYDGDDLTTPIAEVSDPPVDDKVWLDFNCTKDGIYYLRLLWGGCDWVEGKMHYDLRVYDNNFGLTAIVAGKVKDRISGKSIEGAIIRSTGVGAAISTRGGQYLLSEIPGRWTMRTKKDGYITSRTSIRIKSVDQYIREDISMRPRACEADADCDDELFCNGTEPCIYGTCEPGVDPCTDDGEFCNGEETCNEEDDICVHSGSPCPGHLDCVEENDQCVAKECSSDDDCNDGLYCNGTETCVAGTCREGTNPCTEPTPECDEERDLCIEGPTIQLLPNPYLQSRWMPMLFFLRIVGTNTHFVGTSGVTFDPPGAVMALTIFGDDEHLLMLGLLMPSWLMTTQSVEVTVKTGTEVVSEVLNLEYPFMMDNNK